MAGIDFTATSGSITLASATAKTCLQVKSASNQGVWIKGLRVTGGQAAGGTDAAVLVKQTVSSTNFGSASSNSAVSGAINDMMTVTLNTTLTGNFTSEPTSPTDVGDYVYFNPEAGYEVLWPRAEWRFVKPGQARNFTLTAVSCTPTIALTVLCEE